MAALPPEPALAPSELNLVRAFAAGQRALEQLLERHRPELARLGRVMLRDGGQPADASDAAQDTVERLLRRLGGRFEGEDVEAFRAWLRTVFRNVLRNQIRHRRRGCRDAGREVPLPTDSRPGAIPEGTTPSAVASGRETAAGVAAALASLPEADRVLYVLRQAHGWTYQQLVELIGGGSTVDGLRMRVNRLKIELSRHPALRDYRPEGEQE
jgi:RNA polymerase sigma-70 factor (ECF subfamily)